MHALDYPTAESWLNRWDDQQQRYVADREERFAVITDIVRHTVTGVATPTVLDLGCGPGSLAGRLATALPHARIIGIDADPLLLALARAYYPAHHPGVSFAETDLADADWAARAGVPGHVDAVVSTTALHWMNTGALEELYARTAELIRPGGVLVNGDHLGCDTARLTELAGFVRRQRAERAGVGDNEDWQSWWDAVLADERLSGLVDQRSQRAIQHGDSNELSAEQHAEMLRKAGFGEVGTLWRSGDDTVLVAVR